MPMAFYVGDAVMARRLSFTTPPFGFLIKFKSASGFIHFREFLEIVYISSIIIFLNSSLPSQDPSQSRLRSVIIFLGLTGLGLG
jgi:hypothetical protein